MFDAENLTQIEAFFSSHSIELTLFSKSIYGIMKGRHRIMDLVILQQREAALTSDYRVFLSKVREAFNQHCDEIRDEATRRFDAIPEEDQEERQKVLSEQKQALDKTLSELKALLARKSAELRRQLEDIANLKDSEGFDLDDQLATV